MGGIIRDSFRELIVAFAGPSYPCKVIFAELMSLFKGLVICNNRGYVNIQIEVDALILIQIIKNEDVFCPQFFFLIRKICIALYTLNYTMNHVLREGNACADCLAKIGSRLEEDMEIGNDNLLHLLKGLVKLDKIGLRYIKSG
ncbi:hypothetical protein MA16_Dca013424 [Dendrobium catenatum]|uniref:RNase H type-1 domain-containing protein n=1 Tax=Dendrobium catenatum TaxID=906689 RepID=A0A2I0X2V8_9ASPA|nr:hypothetical protein MA16_Dca013424 [Dendrobium catenatum]